MWSKMWPRGALLATDSGCRVGALALWLETYSSISRVSAPPSHLTKHTTQMLQKVTEAPKPETDLGAPRLGKR